MTTVTAVVWFAGLTAVGSVQLFAVFILDLDHDDHGQYEDDEGHHDAGQNSQEWSKLERDWGLWKEDRH